MNHQDDSQTDPLESPRLPAPRKEDVLFRGDLPEWRDNACLNYGGGNTLYVEGYLRGARVLVDRALNDRQQADMLIFPIVYLYRHCIELILKSLLKGSADLTNQPLTKCEKSHLAKHRLDLLWIDVKPKLNAIMACDGSTLDRADITGVDSYIEQLGKMDPGSYAFRYARTKEGSPSVPVQTKLINIRNFSDMMERLVLWLRQLDEAAAVFADYRDEMEEEYASEF